MTENPINPAALYDYAASKNDMDSLRPEERTFLEACAWEWERLIDHGAEEWGKQFEALGIKPGVPQAPSAKPTPAAPEKPAPSSPAAERADEGLEEEAERLREAYTNDEGSWLEWPDCRQEPWLRVARAARALRRGGVTEEPWGIVDDLALSGKVTDTMTAGQPARSRLRNELSAAVRERAALAAKLAEAERALCERAEQVDKLMQERDLVMARLGNFCQPGEIEDRIRILQGHAGKMERQRDEARADAERLRGERDANANARAMMVEVGHALLGCDGHPCRVENGAFTNKDLLTEIKRLQARDDAAMDLCTAPPTVAVTDVEKAAKEINDRIHEEVNDWFKKIGFKGGGPGYWLGLQPVLSILRDCTRAASVEEVAKAIRDVTGRWQIDPRINTSLYIAQAEAVLRALGVREAEKNATPFVVDREAMREAISNAYDEGSGDDGDATDAAITEYERQRAEHAAKGGAS